MNRMIGHSGFGRVICACGLAGLLAAQAHSAEVWYSDDLDNFVDGATIMAAGGGGSAVVAKQLLQEYFTASDSVTLNDVEDIVPGLGYTAATVGAIGSPAALFEIADILNLPYNAYAAMDFVFNEYETPINYLMPIEVGAINGLFPFLLAVKLNAIDPLHSGISVLNVDGGGRSVPTLPLLIYSNFPNIFDQSAVVTSPASTLAPPIPIPSEWAQLTAPAGNQGRIEATILAMVSGESSPYSGAAGYGSFYALADNISEDVVVASQLKVAHDVGGAYEKSPYGASVKEALSAGGRGADVIFSGQVINVTLDTAGLDYGEVTIAGTGPYENDTFVVQYENENICAYKDSYSTDTPFVLGPDSVAYVPTDGTVFDNSDLYQIFQQGGKPMVDIVAITAVGAVVGTPAIMEAWDEVRAKIPGGKCDFPYSSPWLGSRSR